MKKGLVVLNTAIMLTSAFAPVTNALEVKKLTALELPTMEVAEGKQKEFEEEIKNAGYVLSDSNIYTGSTIKFETKTNRDETDTDKLENQYLTREEAEEVAAGLNKTTTEKSEDGKITTVTTVTTEVKETEIDVTDEAKYIVSVDGEITTEEEANRIKTAEEEKLAQKNFKGTVKVNKISEETFYDEGETSKETKTKLTKEEADAEKAKEVNNNEKKVVVNVKVNGTKVITVDENKCSTEFYESEEEALAAANALKEQLLAAGYVEVAMNKNSENRTRTITVNKTRTLEKQLSCPEGSISTVDGKKEVSTSKFYEKSEANYDNENDASVAGQNRITAITNNNTEELRDLTSNTYSKEVGTKKVEIDPTVITKNQVKKDEYDKDVRDNKNNKDVTVSEAKKENVVVESKTAKELDNKIKDSYPNEEEAKRALNDLINKNKNYDFSDVKVDKKVTYSGESTYEETTNVFRISDGKAPDNRISNRITHLDIQTSSNNITVINNGEKLENQKGTLNVTEYYVTTNGTKQEVKFTKGTDPQGYNEYQTYRPREYTPHQNTAEYKKWGYIKNNLKINKDSTVEIYFELTVNGETYNVVYEGHLNQDYNTCRLRDTTGYDLKVDSIVIKDGKIVLGFKEEELYSISGKATKSEERYSYTITTKNYENETIYKYGYEVNGVKPNFVDTYTCEIPYTEEQEKEYTVVKYEVSSNKKEVEAYDVEIETTPKTERIERRYEVEVDGTTTHKEKRYEIEKTTTILETEQVEKEVPVYNVEVNGKLPENPKTYDATTTYAAISFTSIVGMLLSALALKKKKSNK